MVVLFGVNPVFLLLSDILHLDFITIKERS